MHRRCIALPFALILFLAAPGAAGAAEGDPCPANQPRPTITVSDPAGAGSLYATHILRVRFGQSGNDSTVLRSFAAPGARVLGDDNAGARVRPRGPAVADRRVLHPARRNHVRRPRLQLHHDRDADGGAAGPQSRGRRPAQAPAAGRSGAQPLVQAGRLLVHREARRAAPPTSRRSRFAHGRPAARSSRARAPGRSHASSASASSTRSSSDTATAARTH